MQLGDGRAHAHEDSDQTGYVHYIIQHTANEPKCTSQQPHFSDRMAAVAVQHTCTEMLEEGVADNGVRQSLTSHLGGGCQQPIRIVDLQGTHPG